MQTEHLKRSDLASMAATLCSYENWLGPYHPLTLHLMNALAVGYWRHGELGWARRLMETAVRDCAPSLGRTHEMRLCALASLRELLIQQGEDAKAGVIQRELLDCQMQRFGADHPETLAAQTTLAAIMMNSSEGCESMEGSCH